MSAVKTRIYSSFDDFESAALQDFKKECFYVTGEDVKNHDFWQQFFNLFFIYHFDTGSKTTLADKRGLEKARIMLFSPSLFSRLKGEDFFTGEKLNLSEDEENSLTWYRERDFILSYFHEKEDGIHFVESRSSLLIPQKAASFFKKLRTLMNEKHYFPSNNYLQLLIAILMLKKERFSSSKLYNPYQIEEIEKLHLYYSKFADFII